MSSFFNIPRDIKDKAFGARVSSAIDQLSRKSVELEQRLALVRKQSQPQPTQPSPFDPTKLSKDQLTTLAKLLNPELQAGGSAPIHAEQLLGQLAQPQYANIPFFTTTPSTSDPSAQDGALVLVGSTPATGVLNRWDGSKNDPPTLVPIPTGGGGGTGTVTTVSAGNFSPLFTTSISNPTTTPNLTFTTINQSPNVFYCGPSSFPSGPPAFRNIAYADIPIGSPQSISDITSVVVGSSNVPQQLKSFQIQSDSFVGTNPHLNGVGQAIRITTWGNHNPSTNTIVTLALQIGSTIGGPIIASWVMFFPTQSQLDWYTQVTIWCNQKDTGSGGVVRCKGLCTMNLQVTIGATTVGVWQGVPNTETGGTLINMAGPFFFMNWSVQSTTPSGTFTQNDHIVEYLN